MSPNNHMDRTWGAIVVGAVGAGASIYNASKNRDLAEGAAEDAEAIRLAEQAKLDAQKAEYKKMKITNPFANMENEFSENVYEDLTVNQQQAQFQAQQGSQQRANIMQNMKGAAGSSGIAGLAQVLANQGSLQTQQISASIGQQESRNQALTAKGAYQVQQGAAAIQTYDRQGQQWVQQAKMDRQATLLGMQMGQTTGANLASQQAQANQMNAQIAQNNAMTGLFEVAGQAAGNIDFSGGGGGIPKDTTTTSTASYYTP
jgi:hypothetical protein